MRRIYLNDGWTFYPAWNDALKKEPAETGGYAVRLPHTASVLPYNYADQTLCAQECAYTRSLKIPSSFSTRKIGLTFEGVAQEAVVFVNGRKIAEHTCAYTAFTVDVSSYIKYGSMNYLAVEVKPASVIGETGRMLRQKSNPGFEEKEYPYLGIYRDVFLTIQDPSCMEDVWIQTRNLSQHAAGPAELELSVCLSEDMRTRQGYLQIFIFDEQDNCLDSKKKKIGKEGQEKKEDPSVSQKEYESISRQKSSGQSLTGSSVSIRMHLARVVYWDVERPKLYYAEVLLCEAEGKILDSARVRFGFRDLVLQRDGFYLNGRKMKLEGGIRHQSYPYIGYAAPKSLQQLDASLIKNELDLNTVWTAGYPQSCSFIEKCDELGLLVIMQIPFFEKADIVQETILQFRNHPSIVAWELCGEGGRGGEENLRKVLRRVNRLDPSRICKSILGVVPGERKLAFERAVCVTDYQTASASLKGDGICYDGAMDLFRNPKQPRTRFEIGRKNKNQPVKRPYLEVWCSKTELLEEQGYDMALLRIRAIDEEKNVLPFYTEPIRLRCSGQIEIVGPALISLKDGCGGTYVRSLGRSGTGTLWIEAEGMETLKIGFMVRRTKGEFFDE